MPPGARPATPIPAEVREANLAIRAGRIDDAIALLDRALARDPGCAAAHSTRGMALLSQGRFEEGFAAYEWRHRVRGFEGDRPALPRWDGGAAEGRTLLLWDEQGLGDTIQFARFAAPAARASEARIIVCANPRLCRLLRSGARGWEMRGRDRGFPPADLQLSLMSVPAALRLGARDLGDVTGGLAAEAEVVSFWRDRLAGLGPRPRVGLTWRGNPAHPDDPRRSAPVAALARFVRRWAEKVSFVSLQKNAASQELDTGTLPIVDLGPELDVGPDAFVDTAAAMSTLDLMLTTDTAAAHLAGSLGLPVWLLLARPCDWRWGHEGERSPFYETARLFRQPAAGDWDGLFDLVGGALAASSLGDRSAAA
jgi:hypothetical protein